MMINLVGFESAFSVFANETGEPLAARIAAAKELCQGLATLPESKAVGPVRTAMIKCEMASRFSRTHAQATDWFCDVSRLVYLADLRIC
ncbi:hypothetical protein D3C85_98730 [compost metagenome]